MSLLNKISLNDAITLYYEKLSAVKNGDMLSLLALKKKYPDLFKKESEAEILDVIQYAKNFQASKRYQELKREMLRHQLVLIKDES